MTTTRRCSAPMGAVMTMVTVLFAASPAAAQQHVVGYLQCTGIQAGDTGKGDYPTAAPGFEEAAPIVALKQTVTVPFDTQQGTTTGARVHDTVRVTKPVDRSTAQFAQALAQGGEAVASDHHVVLARAGLGEDLAGDVFMLDGRFGLPGEVVLAVEARGGVGQGHGGFARSA